MTELKRVDEKEFAQKTEIAKAKAFLMENGFVIKKPEDIAWGEFVVGAMCLTLTVAIEWFGVNLIMLFGGKITDMGVNIFDATSTQFSYATSFSLATLLTILLMMLVVFLLIRYLMYIASPHINKYKLKFTVEEQTE